VRTLRRNSAGSSSEESPCGIVTKPHNERGSVSRLPLLTQFTRHVSPRFGVKRPLELEAGAGRR
jgi:hypothetical protein